MSLGFYLNGVFVGSRVRDDGKVDCLIACGVNAYRVKVTHLPDYLTLGDTCMLEVFPSVFEGKLFWRGVFCENIGA